MKKTSLLESLANFYYDTLVKLEPVLAQHHQYDLLMPSFKNLFAFLK